MTKEVKAGDSIDFTIGEKVLTVEAVPYGNVKKIFKIVVEGLDAMSKETGEPALMKVPKIMEEKVGGLLPLLFRKDKYEFMTAEWIDDNLTLNDIRGIMETAIKVNGLEDFFTKVGGRFPTAPKAVEPESMVQPTV